MESHYKERGLKNYDIIVKFCKKKTERSSSNEHRQSVKISSSFKKREAVSKLKWGNYREQSVS